MNDIKKELLKTVGDVTKSKQRVIVDVERRLETPDIRHSKRWFPFVAAAFAVICFLLISPQLLQQETLKEQASFAAIDEELFELAKARLQALDWDDEHSIEQYVKNDYVEYLLWQRYADIHNIRITKKDLENAQINQVNQQMFQELEKNVLDYFEQNGYSTKQYDKLFNDYLLPRAALKEKLMAPITEKYSSFKGSTHEFLLTMQIHEYFEAKFEDEYFSLLEQYNVNSPLFGYTFDVAVVLLVKEEAILYFNPDDIMFDDDQLPIRWAPRKEDWDVQEGDIVTVAFNSGYTLDESEAIDGYPNVTHVKTMEKEDDKYIHFVADQDVLKATMDSLNWTESSDMPTTKAQYFITDNLRTYKGYLSEDRGHVTWYYDGKQTDMTLSKALNLLLNVWN